MAWMGMSVVSRADGLPLESRVDYWRETLSNVFMPLDLSGEVGPEDRLLRSGCVGAKCWGNARLRHRWWRSAPHTGHSD